MFDHATEGIFDRVRTERGWEGVESRSSDKGFHIGLKGNIFPQSGGKGPRNGKNRYFFNARRLNEEAQMTFL